MNFKLFFDFNFRSKHWVESGHRVYWLKVNKIIIPLAVAFIEPNFNEIFDINASSKKVSININDLSFIFFISICCLIISLVVFILEILMFILNYHVI